MQKYCKNCGSELTEGSVFCDECGTRVGESSNAANTLFQSYNIDMMEGESVIRQSQMHSGCLIPPAIVFGLGILSGFINLIIALIYYYIDFDFVILSFFNLFTVVGLIWFIIRFIAYKTNDLILTNKRVFGKCGLISTT